jgi:hypothetical protein
MGLGWGTGALWSRLRGLVSSKPLATAIDVAVEGGASPPKWPHLARGWLDPSVSLAGWRHTVQAGDLEDVLRAAAAASDGRLGDSEVAEVLDVLAHTAAGRTRAFRFGGSGRHVFSQLWVGFARESSGAARVFVLGDEFFVQRLEKGLSLAAFSSGEKRAECELLQRFFVTAWTWRWTRAPGSADLRAKAPRDFDPSRTAEGMRRILSDPAAPFHDVLRGLRRRTLELLEDTSDLDRAGVEQADAYLAEKGAPTLSEMRTRYGSGGGQAPALLHEADP